MYICGYIRTYVRMYNSMYVHVLYGHTYMFMYVCTAVCYNTLSVCAHCSGLTDTVMCETTNHTGPVRCLDVNPFQSNLLVSGASDSEIYIWDLNNPSTPMSPGSKTQVRTYTHTYVCMFIELCGITDYQFQYVRTYVIRTYQCINTDVCMYTYAFICTYSTLISFRSPKTLCL